MNPPYKLIATGKLFALLLVSAFLMIGCNDDEDDPGQVDRTLPLVNILSPQQSPSTVPLNVQLEIEAVAYGEKNIDRIEIREDGELLPNGTITTEPYTWAWQGDSIYGIPRTIVVTAFDTEGFQSSDSLELTFWNGVQLNRKPTERYAYSADVVNGKIYVIGGYNSANTAFQTVEEYDPELDSWTTKAPSNFGHAAHASAVVNGKIYVFGGDKGMFWHAGSEVYDPVLDAWSAIDSIPLDTNVGRGLQTATPLNGDVYMFGGEASPLSTITGVYNTVSDNWSLGAVRHVFNAESITVDGEIYLMGGCPERAVGVCEFPGKTVESYNPATQLFTSLSDMHHQRFGHLATEVDGKIYVFGGSSRSTEGLVKAEVYDPLTDQWTELIDIPTDEINFGCVTVDGTIYIIGSETYAYFPE